VNHVVSVLFGFLVVMVIGFIGWIRFSYPPVSVYMSALATVLPFLFMSVFLFQGHTALAVVSVLIALVGAAVWVRHVKSSSAERHDGQ
jgi:hypothetical protein